jgi:hypothetical protein
VQPSIAAQNPIARSEKRMRLVAPANSGKNWSPRNLVGRNGS